MGFTKNHIIDELKDTPFETQKTLKGPISCVGVGLHSGVKVPMVLKPAEPDVGIRFRRIDLAGGGAFISAKWDHVVETRLCTTIGNAHGVTIATVEHLMAALAGCGIDNAEIEVNGPEVPVMDGSSEPFVFLIECAGVRDLGVPRRAIRVLRPISVEADGRSATLLPGEGFEIDCEIDFDSIAVSRQAISLGLVNGAFKKELSRARTFGFLHEVEQLWAAGLARGGSLKNAVVVSGDKVLNREGLRYEDEFVRHKALDALGDLYLAGSPIIGRFRGLCSGHYLNNMLLHALFANPEAWRYDVLRTTMVRKPVVSRAWQRNEKTELVASA